MAGFRAVSPLKDLNGADISHNLQAINERMQQRLGSRQVEVRIDVLAEFGLTRISLDRMELTLDPVQVAKVTGTTPDSWRRLLGGHGFKRTLNTNTWKSPKPLKSPQLVDAVPLHPPSMPKPTPFSSPSDATRPSYLHVPVDYAPPMPSSADHMRPAPFPTPPPNPCTTPMPPLAGGFVPASAVPVDPPIPRPVVPRAPPTADDAKGGTEDVIWLLFAQVGFLEKALSGAVDRIKDLTQEVARMADDAIDAATQQRLLLREVRRLGGVVPDADDDDGPLRKRRRMWRLRASELDPRAARDAMRMTDDASPSTLGVDLSTADAGSGHATWEASSSYGTSHDRNTPDWLEAAVADAERGDSGGAAGSPSCFALLTTSGGGGSDCDDGSDASMSDDDDNASSSDSPPTRGAGMSGVLAPVAVPGAASYATMDAAMGLDGGGSRTATPPPMRSFNGPCVVLEAGLGGSFGRQRGQTAAQLLQQCSGQTLSFQAFGMSPTAQNTLEFPRDGSSFACSFGHSGGGTMAGTAVSISAEPRLPHRASEVAVGARRVGAAADPFSHYAMAAALEASQHGMEELAACAAGKMAGHLTVPTVVTNGHPSGGGAGGGHSALAARRSKARTRAPAASSDTLLPPNTPFGARLRFPPDVIQHLVGDVLREWPLCTFAEVLAEVSRQLTTAWVAASAPLAGSAFSAGAVVKPDPSRPPGSLAGGPGAGIPPLHVPAVIAHGKLSFDGGPSVARSAIANIPDDIRNRVVARMARALAASRAMRSGVRRALHTLGTSFPPAQVASYLPALERSVVMAAVGAPPSDARALPVPVSTSMRAALRPQRWARQDQYATASPSVVMRAWHEGVLRTMLA